MAKIEKLPSGKYRTRVYDRYTKRQKSFTANTKADLKRMVSEWEYLNDDTRDKTIKEIVDQYIEDRSSVLSPSTLRAYVQMQKNIKPIEHYSAKQIKSEDLQRFVNELSKTLKPKTVKNIYGLVSSALNVFYPNKAINVRLPQIKPTESSLPSSKDIELLLEYAHPELKKAILLASVGTMRRGEIAALTYGDIDGCTIHVHADIVQDKNNKWIYKDMPKTSESDRYIEYPLEVIKELGEGLPDERIIKFANPEMITQYFIVLRNKLGMNCRFHDLRHYAASIMHAIGIPDQYIMARGGWKSDRVLKSVYRNVIEEARKTNEQKINDYFSKNLLGKE